MRCESTRLCGVKMVYNDLENMLNEDNWDNGFEIPKEILADPRCDLAVSYRITCNNGNQRTLINP